MTKEPVHVISLGAGVQSSTMALMAARGELTPMPVAAIFADTQAEPKGVYTWLDWLEGQLPFKVIRATAGNLTEELLRVRQSKKSGNFYTRCSLPAYTLNVDGSVGHMRRGCTYEFKVEVLNRAMRALKAPVTCWIGISRDEAHRMKPSREKMVTNIWPLVDRGITRSMCLDWMKNAGYPVPPRSACSYCPYHSDAEWLRIKTHEPETFAEAVKFERDYQVSLGQTQVKAIPFLHRTCKPIDQIDFSPDRTQPDLFGNECEGICGV